jgi:hypothetical protein
MKINRRMVNKKKGITVISVMPPLAYVQIFTMLEYFIISKDISMYELIKSNIY